MAQTPEEIKAKKIAKKRAQINAKVAQMDKYEAKKGDANSLKDAAIVSSQNTTDVKVKAKIEKSIVVLDKRIVRLQGSIDRLEVKRLQYAQELATLLGRF